MNRMVFASEPIELRLDGLSKRTVQSTKPYSGVLRFALIPPPTPTSSSDNSNSTKTTTTTVIQEPPYPSIPSLNNSTTVQHLIYYSHVYPVGGSISWDFDSITLRSPPKDKQIADAKNEKTGLFGWMRKSINGKGTNTKRTIGTVTFQYDVRSIVFVGNNVIVGVGTKTLNIA